MNAVITVAFQVEIPPHVDKDDVALWVNYDNLSFETGKGPVGVKIRGHETVSVEDIDAAEDE